MPGSACHRRNQALPAMLISLFSQLSASQARQTSNTLPHLSRKKSSSSRSSRRCSEGRRCAYTLRLYTTAAFRLAISRSAATSSKKVGRRPSPPNETNDMAA